MSPDELLMKELESIVNQASKDLDESSKSEAMEVLGLLSEQFDLGEESKGYHLFALTVHDPNLVDEAESDPNAKVLHRNIDPKDKDQAVGGKVSHIAHGEDMEALVKGIQDQEAMLLIAYKIQPMGLLARANYDDGSRFTIMATPDHVATERKTVDGKVLSKCYVTSEGKPEDIETYSDSEQALVRDLWGALCMPMMLKQKYPQSFETLAQEVYAKWKERFGNDGDTD